MVIYNHGYKNKIECSLIILGGIKMYWLGFRAKTLIYYTEYGKGAYLLIYKPNLRQNILI